MEGRVNTPIPLARRVEGPPAGPAVVLLHGFALTRAIWDAQVGPLTSAGFRVIAPDLRGHGETPGGNGPATMPLCAADVLALLDALDVSRATLCGLSMGGYVALEMLAQAPERVSGLVLSNARADADTPLQRDTRLQLAKSLQGPGERRLGGRLLSSYFAPRTLEEQPELLAHVRALVHAQQAQNLVHAIEGVAQREARLDALRDYAGPSLFLVGRHDMHTPVAKSEAMQKVAQAGELVVLEDAGHLSPIERPPAWNAALLGWLARHA